MSEPRLCEVEMPLYRDERTASLAEEARIKRASKRLLTWLTAHSELQMRRDSDSPAEITLFVTFRARHRRCAGNRTAAFNVKYPRRRMGRGLY